MKHLLAISISFFTSFALQAMEQKSDRLEAIYLTKNRQTTVQTHDMVEHVNTILTKKYGTTQNTLNFINEFVDISSISPYAFTEQTATEILTTVTSCYQKGEPTSDCAEQLYAKNVIFKNAIDHFSNIAFKNIQDANCTTLSTIENPALAQPSPQLNTFCYALKKCIIDKAIKKIDHSYKIQLSGYINCPIEDFQCCASQDIVATGIPKASTIDVWNLNSVTKLLQIPIKNILRTIALTSDGSNLIVCEETTTKPKTAHVAGWNLSTGTATWSLEQPGTIEYVLDTSNVFQKIIAIFALNYRNNAYHTDQHLWSIQDNTPYYLGTINDVTITEDNKSAYNPFYDGTVNFNDKYIIKHPYYVNEEKKHNLFITKKNCPAVYLCEQAIKNNKHCTSLSQVKNSQAYQQLTDYEKSMIEQKIIQKTIELTALKQHQKKRTDTATLTFTYK